jgi:hypothetical protein
MKGESGVPDREHATVETVQAASANRTMDGAL